MSSDQSAAPRKIIIDTDPGIDDAMAIIYALASPELQVVGLTTVFGNAYVENCTANALHILEVAGHPEVPVSKGTARPLAMPFRGPATFVHGQNGLADIELPTPSRQVHALDAAQFIIEQVRAAPGEITLVPIGPLTNIALAMLLWPDLPLHIAGMVIMGGNAFCPGNASPAAEANIINDPEAADMVFGADCPIVMCGLDVTERTVMTNEHIEAIARIDNPRARLAAQILPHYNDFHRAHGKNVGIFVHDSTCISYLLAPQHYGTAAHPIRVDCGDGVGRGKTWPSLRHLSPGGPWTDRRPVTILTEVDGPAVVAIELERLTVD